jgi:hypothetical protein
MKNNDWKTGARNFPFIGKIRARVIAAVITA